MSKLEQFKADDIIIMEGDACPDLYKIISGEVACYTSYGKKDEYLIGLYGKDRFLCVEDFLNNHTSHTTCVVVEDVLAMRITQEEFPEYIRTNTANAMDIMKHLAKGIHLLNKHIQLVTNELEAKELSNQAERVDVKRKMLESKYLWMSV